MPEPASFEPSEPVCTVDDLDQTGGDPGIAAWGVFNYMIMKRTSWLARRVENWSYTGSATWVRSFSLDLDINFLRLSYIWYYWQSLLPDDICEVDPSESILGIPARYAVLHEDDGEYIPPSLFSDKFFDLPVIEIDKCKQFSNFDARDASGNALHLSMRGVGIQTTMSALIGAIAIEHGEAAPEGEQLEPLVHTDDLSGFLSDWFSAEHPPQDDGNRIDPNTKEGLEKTKKAALKGMELKADEEEWEADQLDAAQKRFCLYFDKSPIFRYYLKTFTFKRLICVRICLGDEAHSLIKCKYDAIRDLFGNKEEGDTLQRVMNLPRHVRNFAGGLRFEMELDGIGLGEVDHTTIEAPEGTYLSPAKEPRREDQNEERAKLYVLDDLPYDPLLSNSDIEYKPYAQATATLTQGRVTLKTKKAWKDVPERKYEPSRRLPVDGAREHRYLLNLRLVPKLGLRSLGYISFLFFSAVAFLMCLLNPEVYLDTMYRDADSPFSLGSLLVIAPMIIMVVANKDETPYIRRQIFKAPRWLAYFCVFVDILGFLWFFIAGLQLDEKQLGLFAGLYNSIAEWNPALVGLAACTISLACAVLWWTIHTARTRRWTSKPGAYDQFPVPFYAPSSPVPFAVRIKQVFSFERLHSKLAHLKPASKSSNSHPDPSAPAPETGDEQPASS